MTQNVSMGRQAVPDNADHELFWAVAHGLRITRKS
jgi:hypothetical protein